MPAKPDHTSFTVHCTPDYKARAMALLKTRAAKDREIRDLSGLVADAMDTWARLAGAGPLPPRIAPHGTNQHTKQGR